MNAGYSSDHKALDAQHISIGITVGDVACASPRQHIAAHRRIFVGCCKVIIRCRRRVAYRPLERLIHRSAVTITGRDRHTMHTAREGLACRRIDRATDHSRCRVDAQALRQATRTVSQHISINVGKKAAHVQRRDRLRISIILRPDYTHRLRRVVYRIDCDDKIGRVATTLTVAHCIGDGWHHAVPVHRRREAVRAVCRELKNADTRNSYIRTGRIVRAVNNKTRDDKTVVVRVAVIGQCITGNWPAVFHSTRCVISCNRRLAFTPSAACSGRNRCATSNKSENPGPPNQPRYMIEFDFRKVEFAPLFGILPPPDDPVVVLQNQVVARFFFVDDSFTTRCNFIRSVAVRIFNKERQYDDFLAILKDQNEIITTSHITSNTFRCQL